MIRYKPSGVYFARVRIRGKLFRQTLKTSVISVAKLRLADFINEKTEELGDVLRVDAGRMTVADAVALFHERLNGQQNIKEGAKVYRRKCLEALLKSWPDLESTLVWKVTKDDCLAWAKKFAEKYSATVYNNTVGTLRMILDLAVENGARLRNPAYAITKKRVIPKALPSIESRANEMTKQCTKGGNDVQ